MFYISIKKKKTNINSTKKHILESAANIKFICKLYLIAIYSLKITYHGELSMNE